MLNDKLLDLLYCPVAPESKLRLKNEQRNSDLIIEGELICEQENLSFKVTHGVPDLIPYHLLSDEKWKMWQDHLEGFQARREQRVKKPEEVITKMSNKSKPNRYFAEFTNIREGVMLDIGCGPGKFRHNFDPKKVHYIGLDPIILPEVDEFPFVRALAEYIPFADNTFTDVVSLSAIDHFRELDTFFEEVIRVLKPDGRLHILQSIHEIRGPISAAKMLTHYIKDKLEDRATKVKNADAPKHIYEFSQRSLMDSVNKYFDVIARDTYSFKWYSPTKAFITLRPKAEIGEPVS
ncbi:MAG: methyltransferase domain-containing protein [Calditrichaeota bacterium]|nr:methyltransferase domain-containing protein [Calditrichota bacterium]